MKVVWSPLAIERAAEEAAFIASDKPEAAKRWLTGLFAAVDRPESFALSGKRVPEIPSDKYRQLIYKTHRVVYRIGDDTVAVLTIRRSAQLLRPEDLS